MEGIFLARVINHDLAPQWVHAAMQHTVSDYSAWILETHVRGLRKTASMLDSIFVISPMFAIVHTKTTSKQDWEALMTMQVRDHPEETISAIKWRKSQHGGRSWASPLMCESQVKGLLQMVRV